MIYEIDPGPVHKLVLVEITGNKNFWIRPSCVRTCRFSRPAGFLSHGRYSEALLKSDVATLERLYRSNGFRAGQDRNQGRRQLSRCRRISWRFTSTLKKEPGREVGEVQVVGEQKIAASELPELSTQPGQPYSEQELANDRERILSYYFDHGFPNASLEITTKPSAPQPNREDVTYTIQEGERFTVNQVMVGGHRAHARLRGAARIAGARRGAAQPAGSARTPRPGSTILGIFSQVDTAVQNPEGTDPQKNVLVQVREAKRYTFTYGVGLEFETGQPAGATAPQGTTGVSPRVEFDVTRLNVGGRDQTLTFQSHVGRLQQRGLVSYEIPKLLDSDKFKLIYTIFYDNSLDVATFTSQRLEGKDRPAAAVRELRRRSRERGRDRIRSPIAWISGW